MHSAAEYQPYRKKARWKRILDKQLVIVNKKLSVKLERLTFISQPDERNKSLSRKEDKNGVMVASIGG